MRVFIFALFVAAASAASLYQSSSAIPNKYIVKLNANVNANAFAKTLPQGVTVTKVWTNVLNAVAVETKNANVLLALGGVEYVQEDSLVHASVEGVWGRTSKGVKGNAAPAAGAGIYVVDTGLRYSHVEFGGNASPFYDFEGGNGGDCNGHGTHVGSVAVAQSNGAASYSVRVLNCAGAGSTSDIIDGLNAIIAGGDAATSVVNLSFGGSANSALDDAVRNVISAGFATVVAAGNNGDNACNYSPARVTEATTVGAEGEAWSNYGACVDQYAPGTDINGASNECDTCYVTLSGTSQAAAHVSGTTAAGL